MATRRVPVESSVRAEALQAISQPRAQGATFQADPAGSSAFQLAAQLGAAYPLAEKLNNQIAFDEKQKATEWANSLSPEELRKRIDNGDFPMWQSPLFTATVQHIDGVNQAKGLYRDAEQKLALGEIKTRQELDEFIENRRAGYTQGQSNYAVAGFDRSLGPVREKLYGSQTAYETKRYATQSASVAVEDLDNALAEVTGTQFDGKTNTDRVSYILGKYNMHRTSYLLNDDSAREAMEGVLTKIAKSGNKELLDEFLKTKLPNNGPSIQTFIDVKNGQDTSKTLQLKQVAATAWDRNQKEAEQRVLQAQSEVILNAAGQQADLLVSTRNGATMPDVTLPTGKVVKGKDLVAASIQKQLEANPEMPLAEQVRLFKTNGVKNSAWENELKAAVYNIGEVTLDAQGKPAGQLLDSTARSIEQFAVIRQVDDQYAKDLVGEDNYKILNRIQALREAGIPDLNSASALVSQINRRSYDPNTWGNIQKDVTKAVEDIKNPGVFTGRFWSELFRGEFGEGDKNILPIEGNVRYLAETYLLARVAPDAKTAVQLATDYMQKSVVQVNNTMYMLNDLPRVPDGEDAVQWFGKYKTDVIMPRLKNMGIDPSLSDLTLIPMKGGQPMYIVANKAMPLPNEGGVGTMTITRSEVEEWVKGSISERINTQVEEGNKKIDKRQKGPRRGYIPDVPLTP